MGSHFGWYKFVQALIKHGFYFQPDFINKRGGPADPNLLPDSDSFLIIIIFFELTHWAGFCTVVVGVNN